MATALGENLQRGGPLRKMGDYYFHRIYPRVTELTQFTDHFEGPITDHYSLMFIYYRHVLATVGGLALTAGEAYLLSKPELSQLVESGMKLQDLIPYIAAGLGGGVTIGVGGFMGTYGGNYLATPLHERVGLTERDFDLDEELEFVIGELNSRVNTPPLDFDQAVPLAHTAVESFMIKYYGGRIAPASRKIKDTRYPTIHLRNGAIARVDPITHEVIFHTHASPEVLPHELLHQQGIPQEKDAEIGGIIALIESDSPSMQYLGYRYWLARLMTIKMKQWYEQNEEAILAQEYSRDDLREIHYRILEELGLQARTIEEFREQRDKIDEVAALPIGTELINQKLRALSNLIKKKPQVQSTEPQEQAPKAKRKPRKSLRDIILRLTGQGDRYISYVEKPTRLLHDYRLKQLSESTPQPL